MKTLSCLLRCTRPLNKASSHPQKQRSSSRAKPSRCAWEQADQAVHVLLAHHRMVCDSPLLHERSLLPMTTTFPQPPTQSQQQDAPPATCASPSAFPDLSTLSTLWVPLHEVRQQWAAFSQEALTTSALMASSTAFGGLYWETHALQHSTWAPQERVRVRWHQVVFWLSRAVQDLDCALDRWQQVLSWLDLAGNDHRQQDPESLLTIRTLMAQVQWHQGRRRTLHQQVLSEYIEARQHKQQWDQQGSQHMPVSLSEEQEEV